VTYNTFVTFDRTEETPLKNINEAIDRRSTGAYSKDVVASPSDVRIVVQNGFPTIVTSEFDESLSMLPSLNILYLKNVFVFG